MKDFIYLESGLLDANSCWKCGSDMPVLVAFTCLDCRIDAGQQGRLEQVYMNMACGMHPALIGVTRIGRSVAQLTDRLLRNQNMSPIPVHTIFLSREEPMGLEKAIHRRLSIHRVYKDWYATQAVFDFLADKWCRGIVPQEPQSRSHPRHSDAVVRLAQAIEDEGARAMAEAAFGMS